MVDARKKQSMASDIDDATLPDLLRSTLSASRALVALSAQSIASVDTEVGVVQVRALVVVASRGSVSLGQLAQGVRISLTRASRLCERMVGAGLLTRTEDPGDRRQLILTLTGRGRQIVREVNQRREDAIAAVLERVLESQRPAVATGFAAFAQAAGGSPDDPDLWALGWPS